jgi:hypothetical protein
MIRSKKDYFGMAPFSDLKNVASAALSVMQGKSEKEKEEVKQEVKEEEVKSEEKPQELSE